MSHFAAYPPERPDARRRHCLASAAAGLLLPGPAWASSAPAGLPGPLRALVQGAGLPLHSIGLQVLAVQGTAPPLASLNADTGFQLASTTKLVTAMAALDLLGPDYRWRTQAHLQGTLSGGRLLGDLIIVGGGNAMLRTAELRSWFMQMREHGLDEVWGDIVLDHDGFLLSDADHAGTPAPGADRPHHAWPAALTLDEGRLQLSVRPGLRGQPRLQLTPPMAGVQINPQFQAGGGCAVSAQWMAATASGGSPQLLVRGRWSPACGDEQTTLSPLPHEEFTSRAVAGLWREAGGRVKGRVRSRVAGVDPTPQAGRTWLDRQGQAVAPWSVHQSAPLPDLIREINKTSDNLAARCLMLSLAPGFPQRSATLPHARAHLQRWLQQGGLAPGDIVVDNGSGLSREERGKPEAMVALLRRAHGSALGPDFVRSLPVAGIDGTLAKRMTRGAATGRAFLKTGSLLDTRALAGYVHGRSGRIYALAALVNHPEAQRATPMLDALVEWVAANA